MVKESNKPPPLQKITTILNIQLNILQDEKPMAYYGICDTPAGKYLIADTDQGVCWLSFINKSEKEAVIELEDFWGSFKLKHDIKIANKLAIKLFIDWSSKNKSIPVLVFGTPFQIKQ